MLITAKMATECVDELFKAIPKRKQMEFLGELNEAMLYISAAEKAGVVFGAD